MSRAYAVDWFWFEFTTSGKARNTFLAVLTMYKMPVTAKSVFVEYVMNLIFKQFSTYRGTGQLQPHPPIFFKKVEIFIPLEVYTYVVTACLILLATSTSLRRYVNFFLWRPFFKVYF